ncbi:hypothetical protein STRIP9103_06018 [Streptomyces ipomoeae 91-03]|uniref:Uncharacterized protein n=1 Tax=Streptomyces ipomoeae 91-03 TaxID=698759 RepID=L1KR29_9ACTN|nr:hypothetical protein STRIP9103_06018 [Streptomyces ipomoeae 91-03]
MAGPWIVRTHVNIPPEQPTSSVAVRDRGFWPLLGRAVDGRR